MRLWLLSLLAACPLFLSAILACGIPSQEDVDQAIDDATDECRAIARAEFALVALPLLEVIKDECRGIGDRSVDAILIYVGCTRAAEGAAWDCDGARARACEGLP
jgi:hypothetical protein